MCDWLQYRLRMLTALDAPADALTEDEREFVRQIRLHGWFDTHVFADEDGPGFSYTTGFWVTLNHPEVIIVGLERNLAHNILWDVFRDIQAGRRLAIGTRLDDVIAKLPVFVFPVGIARYPDYLGWSRWFYGHDDFPCVHLVWPDPSGVFPWDRQMHPDFHGLQPDLTDDGWRAALAN